MCCILLFVRVYFGNPGADSEKGLLPGLSGVRAVPCCERDGRLLGAEA
jgi:hypothetical protein